MDSDFSIRNELDSVVRGQDSDAHKYSSENPFSKMVDAFKSNDSTKSANESAGPNNHFSSDDGWRAQAFFASSVAQQQAEVAHRAIDLAHRSLLGDVNKPNYWKYVAIASLGVIVLILLVYWKSSVKLKLVPETQVPDL